MDVIDWCISCDMPSSSPARFGNLSGGTPSLPFGGSSDALKPNPTALHPMAIIPEGADAEDGNVVDQRAIVWL